MYGALFINSDFSSPGLQNNRKQCAKCQTLMFAGNLAPESALRRKSRQHTGQELSGRVHKQWRRRTKQLAVVQDKCQALSSPALLCSTCRAGGQHDDAGSGNYVLVQISGLSRPGDQSGQLEMV